MYHDPKNEKKNNLYKYRCLCKYIYAYIHIFCTFAKLDICKYIQIQKHKEITVDGMKYFCDRKQ